MIFIMLLVIRLIRKKKDDDTIVARIQEKFPNFNMCTELRGGEKDLKKFIKQVRRALDD